MEKPGGGKPVVFLLQGGWQSFCISTAEKQQDMAA